MVEIVFRIDYEKGNILDRSNIPFSGRLKTGVSPIDSGRIFSFFQRREEKDISMIGLSAMSLRGGEYFHD